MKSLKSFLALMVAVTLVGVGAGCKKTPKNTTFIPSIRTAPPTDDTTRTGPLPGTQKGTGTGNPATPPGSKIGDGPGTTDTQLTGTETKGTSLPPVDTTKAATQNENPEPGDFTEDATTFAAETVQFEFDRATVKPSEVAKVERVAAFLRNEPNAKLRVEGNADERGTEEYNRSLGERRALAVRELLVHSGIGGDRVSTVTFGEDKPVDQGHDESAWARNRRADFVLLRPRTLQ